VLKKLYENNAILLTINYDDILKKYYNLKHIGGSKIEDIIKFRRGNLNEIFYIYKNYYDPQKIILNTINYYQIRKSNEIQNIFKAFLNDKTILFIRYRSELEDPNFDDLC
jgi:hypothetical protein